MVDNCKAINKETEKKCRKITDDAEEKINESLINIFIPLKEETEKLKKLRFTDFLRSFAACIVLSVFMLLAANYSVAYMKGMNKARSEVTEILEIEREKIKEEAIEKYRNSTDFIKDAKIKIERIEEEAVNKYKDSNDFVIDGATYVANNFWEWRILETFYKEMPVKDKKNLKLYDWLNNCHREYKAKYGDKNPRDF